MKVDSLPFGCARLDRQSVMANPDCMAFEMEPAGRRNVRTWAKLSVVQKPTIARHAKNNFKARDLRWKATGSRMEVVPPDWRTLMALEAA